MCTQKTLGLLHRFKGSHTLFAELWLAGGKAQRDYLRIGQYREGYQALIPDVSLTKIKAMVEPHSVLNDFWRKSVSFIQCR